MTRPSALPPPECIRLKGVRQNNLKGFDLNIPLGRFIVVTGLSGAGKSSLVFETLHAEGQRRYVETFSAYTRQFLDLLHKPRVDSIENIRPSIAIGQSNTVKTSRSTVGTMTELTDFFKVWFSHHASCFDPDTGERVDDDNAHTIWAKALAANPGTPALITFKVSRPANLDWSEILKSLLGQSYVRALHGTSADDLIVSRLEELLARKGEDLGAHLQVVQDRVELSESHKQRFLEAVEAALHFGHGEVFLFSPPDAHGHHREIGHYSRGLRSPKSGRTFRPATPALFSFNSPLGACPRCRGFGRIIEIDYRLAIPDKSKSIDEGAIRCWEGEVYGESKADLLKFARRQGIRTDVPFASLSEKHQDYIVNGEPGYGEEEGKNWPHHWYGVKGFFSWLEKNTYKMHVRIFLSRYRAYNTCPDCGGARMQHEALCWKWRGLTLPDIYRMPVSGILGLLRGAGGSAAPPAGANPSQSDLAFDSILIRLGYLQQVGLDYLTLDRASRTLSGGEVQRVNLTGCLGTALVDTLFVLDEPSVGLHPRDIDRLIAVIRTLTDAGNTVVVVEHDEAMIRAADHVLEIGPEPGARGGNVVFQGSVPAMLASPESITGAYLSGRRFIPVAPQRRPVPTGHPSLSFTGVRKHNLANLDLRIPLQRLVCLSGVSGSGKSTLLDNVIHQGLMSRRHQLTDDLAEIRSIDGDAALGEVVLVDQSPLSRTPRSNAALYVEAWEFIREVYASTPEAEAAGYTGSSFSFNSGDGRCPHCQGLGYERVEMQFLSDVFVPCPVCDGARFKPEILGIQWNGKSIADLLALSIADSLRLFADFPTIAKRLAPLEAVGLGYLTLGQPLNTLSGGEAQRLKLVRYLAGVADAPALLLLDEPTTGLHRHDVKRLLEVLQALVDRGHSVVVIEHNLDVLKSADWIVEVGPEAGAAGGRIVAEGPPESVAVATTETSPYLREALASRASVHRTPSPVALPSEGSVKEGAPPTYRYGSGEGLSIVGARENNLKNLSLRIPHRQLTVITGVSGSGKSTLAFDIVFAEGQRRFMESMSPYARQFVEQMPRPAVDRLTGIPPTVAIEQRVTRGSRKSTVATITEVAQYLRLLYARLGVQHHPETGREVRPLSASELEKVFKTATSPRAVGRARHLYLCAPVVRGRKGHHQPIANWSKEHGYALLRVDGEIRRVDGFQKLDRYKEHDLEVVVADFGTAAKPKPSPKALEVALKLGKGTCFLAHENGRIATWFSTSRTDAATGETFPELDPKNFSFNSPRGWCPACRGHGRIFPWMLEPVDEDEDDPGARLRELGVESPDDVALAGEPCPECHGERLNRVGRAVKLPLRRSRIVRTAARSLSLPELLRSTPEVLLKDLRHLDLDRRGKLITEDILPQIAERLTFLEEVGLGYLSLDRPTETLSGGEAQRIRLASQLGSNLSGALYVLDEPSIGLHASDNRRLIGTLKALRDKGNTLLVVEHDDELMAEADHIIDLGPAAGRHGGELLAAGTPAEIRRSDRSLTGIFLERGIAHPLRGAYRPVPTFVPVGRPLARRAEALRRRAGRRSDWLLLTAASFRNLKGFDLRLPLGRLIMVGGPSGAGKSTLFRDLLRPAVEVAIEENARRLTGAEFVRKAKFTDDEGRPAGSCFRTLEGANAFKAVIEVDQAPIGKTPRSTPATYLGIFDLIRQFFASLPESKLRGYTASRFSFNTAGGRCPTCEGAGRIRLEMAFMPDTYLPCDDCGGLRYASDLADIAWKGRNIGEVLQLTFEEAAVFFDFHSQLSQVCRLMTDCGLGYLTLGQSSPTLSGGEAQRLKLVTELSRGLASYRERSRGQQPRNLYLLEEPTIGLHLSDCEKLIKVLHSLVDQDHTVVVIEHHLDLLAEADYLIELGPEGGPGGGELIYQGPVAGILKKKGSPTAPFLREKLVKFVRPTAVL